MSRFRRAPSPTPSENEPDIDIDIAGDIFADEADESFSFGKNDKKATPNSAALDLDFHDILNAEESDDGDAAYIAERLRSSNRKANVKSVKKGGGFQSMGLNANLLKAIHNKGYSVPTPIQRKAIPLILERRDVVGMARTGSGKTAAFVIPMIERLKGHTSRFGARALIMSPSRELALQTLKVVKEFSRGTDLKAILLVGGDSLEEQFGMMANNPDIIIATPGRFLHLKVEMNLDLSSIKYAVFDEADRLFEMGFAAQLTEILHALPPSRQTLLFSATLPSTLVEFARAGLQDPSLVRLDAETKVSPDLESAFFSVKKVEKEGALLHILNDVIKMPLGKPVIVKEDGDSKKRKRGPDKGPDPKGRPTEHSTIIFTATKHHVEYLANLLKHAGYAVSYIYGSLDQAARLEQVENFRKGRTNILVVTDVAARGIDIPILANVINYDFPPQPKIFVHRVGRTARAGHRGWAFGLVRDIDLPYLIDLQLFLGRKMVLGQEVKEASYAQDVVVGALQRSEVEPNMEWVTKVLKESGDMTALRQVAAKAEKLYMKTRNSASSSSAKKAREVLTKRGWTQLHPLFGQDAAEAEQDREDLLARISVFKPQETIFELGPKGKSSRNKAAEIARNLRKSIGPRKVKQDDTATDIGAGDDDEDMPDAAAASTADDGFEDVDSDDSDSEAKRTLGAEYDDSDDEMEVTVSTSAISKKKGQTNFQDPDIFMTYTPRTTNAAEEKAYGVHTGSQAAHFVEAARDATMDLTNDDGARTSGAAGRSRMRWDKKQNKYVERANDEDGSRGAKMVRGESGVKIAASFKSGRFDRWRKANKMGRMPHVGDTENKDYAKNVRSDGGVRYKHKSEQAPKDADKFRDDYEVRKKRVAEAKEKRVGKYKDGDGNKKEIRDAVDIRKARQAKERKMAKNARPAKRARR
ncbi:P-loop containing nucleoside triphosphate hydrolase protein [Cercophora scortea]|uniref:RNA helicase n=1 Tax=Cercophora scortea TaxID=314031 RepID=A0AAE0IED8_9PEZI|nr:P-loop containing nucleoside triphosphate hydrolase protein [Cercophora scortea]